MPYAVYTLDDLKVLMADRWDSTPFWDDIEAQNALNEALRMWNTLTGYWKDRQLISVVIGQNSYQLPASMVFGFRVEYQNSPLTSTSTFEMDSAIPFWEADSGTPRKWMALDLNTIIIWPTPVLSGTYLTVDGIAATPVLNYDNDFIQAGSDLLNAVIGYALHAVALKEGGERFQATMKYFESFLAAAAEVNNQLEKSEMFRHFMGVDTRREEEPTR